MDCSFLMHAVTWWNSCGLRRRKKLRLLTNSLLYLKKVGLLDRCLVSIKGKQQVVCTLSNGDIANDLNWWVRSPQITHSFVILVVLFSHLWNVWSYNFHLFSFIRIWLALADVRCDRFAQNVNGMGFWSSYIYQFSSFHKFTTIIIHNSSTLSLPAQNLSLSQILPNISSLLLPDWHNGLCLLWILFWFCAVD